MWEVPEIGVIFYVTPQEFDIFSAELSVLANQIPAVHSSRQVYEIEKLEVTKFLLDRITKSKYFAEEDLQMLGRQRVQLAYRSE
ncbi:hypothetical protein [Microseira sp. BLCC-F43]|uniref:hypothetical protein n=1 Tax=Microseira sp. BLCC-F43 TaxID=3153602 RepID=UPI0035B6E325